MIDSHCHFDFSDFDSDRAQEFAHAKSKGLQSLLIPGITLQQTDKQLKIVSEYPDTYFALGLHPYFLTQSSIDDVPELQVVLDNLSPDLRTRCVAIGETGLDFHVDISKQLQLEIFRAQIELATRNQLPLIIHHRKSHQALLEQLKASKFEFGGVIHAYSGSADIAREYVKLGFRLGIGGTITYPRANKTIKAIKVVGIESLLLETDAPDMPMMGRQGQRNSPKYMTQVVARLASTLNISEPDVIRQTTANFAETFKVNSLCEGSQV